MEARIIEGKIKYLHSITKQTDDTHCRNELLKEIVMDMRTKCYQWAENMGDHLKTINQIGYMKQDDIRREWKSGTQIFGIEDCKQNQPWTYTETRKK